MSYGDYDLLPISWNELGSSLRTHLENDKLEESDIGIFKADGSLAGVLISPKAYDFFLAKVEEADDQRDAEIAQQWQESDLGQTLHLRE